MSSLTRRQARSLSSSVTIIDRNVERALVSIESRTAIQLAQKRAAELLRIADVQAEADVASVKIQELQRVGGVALTCDAIMRRQAAIQAGNDPFAADGARFFLDTTRLGMGEVLAGLACTYTRQSLG